MTASLPVQKYLTSASRIVCGAMTLNDANTAQSLIETALETGINMFDHADIYNAGGAESAFGKVLGQKPSLRDDMFVQSKCGIRPGDERGPGRYDWSAQWIERSVENSLRRLQTGYLDLLLLHRPDPLMAPDEISTVFEQLHESGKVRHFGVSNLSGAQMAFLQQHLQRPLIANQIEMSLLHSHWVDHIVTVNDEQQHANRFVPGTLEYCRDQQVQLQAWSSLCQGKLSGRDTADAADAVKHTAALVARLAGEYEVSREAIVLAWLLRHPAGIQPIIGTTNPDRVRACAQATTVTLKREHWWALYVAARDQRVP